MPVALKGQKHYDAGMSQACPFFSCMPPNCLQCGMSAVLLACFDWKSTHTVWWSLASQIQWLKARLHWQYKIKQLYCTGKVDAKTGKWKKGGRKSVSGPSDWFCYWKLLKPDLVFSCLAKRTNVNLHAWLWTHRNLVQVSLCTDRHPDEFFAQDRVIGWTLLCKALWVRVQSHGITQNKNGEHFS